MVSVLLCSDVTLPLRLHFLLNFLSISIHCDAPEAKCRSNRALSAINKRFQFYVNIKKCMLST